MEQKDRKLLQVLEIPHYIREAKLSNSQRAIYYEWNGITIIAKRKKLPIKFINDRKNVIENNGNVRPRHLVKPYAIGIFKGTICFGKIDPVSEEEVWTRVPNKTDQKKATRHYLYDTTTGDLVISNPNTVGQPKYINIKGQDMYSGQNDYLRNNILQAIKSYFKKHVRKLKPITEFPLVIEMEFHDTIRTWTSRSTDEIGEPWDVDNRTAPYAKAFPDVLITEGIIPDDDRLHVTQPPKGIFCPIQNDRDRKLVIKIYQDTRDIIKNSPYYNGTFKIVTKKKDSTGRVRTNKIRKVTWNSKKEK